MTASLSSALVTLVHLVVAYYVLVVGISILTAIFAAVFIFSTFRAMTNTRSVRRR